MSALTIIGRAEQVAIPDLGLVDIPAKVDTGADTSSLWATNITQTEQGLQCTLFGPSSDFYSGTVVEFNEYSVTQVANSFGQREKRYKVKMPIRVGGRLIKASFTLSDRSLMVYPMLIGRRLLQGKFLVDVAKNNPFGTFEAERAQQLDQTTPLQAKKGGNS